MYMKKKVSIMVPPEARVLLANSAKNCGFFNEKKNANPKYEIGNNELQISDRTENIVAEG